MTAVGTLVSFASAYRQLAPAEKAYVDAYVSDVERDAIRRNERISNALYRQVSAETVEASRGMLERPLVRAAITERIREIADGSELTAPRVIKELMAMAFSSLQNYGEVNPDGTVSWDLAKCTPEQWSAVKKIKQEMDPRNPNIVRKQEIELYDKPGAITMLMRYMGLLEPDNPFWRNDAERPTAPSIPAGTSGDVAANTYARYLNG